MSSNTETSDLHKQAANDHSEAAKSHLQAADCLDQNQLSNVKEKAKSATHSYSLAQKSSTAACKGMTK